MEFEFSVPQITSVDVAPLMRGKDLHFAVISVWEEDGDQASTLIQNFNNCVGSVAGMIAALGFELPYVGLVILAIDILIDLVHILTGDADDYIGDYVLVFDREELEVQGYRTIETTVTSESGDNRWTIFLGAEAKKLPNW